MESATAEKTFCFASGELCVLNGGQIERIPYLSAMVSAATGLPSIRNEHGHYKLDPSIEPPYFAFVLESFSFHSIRQMFTHLPTRMDVISIIALLDFLGLAPQDEPTFAEINQTFFFTMVYKPSTGKSMQKIVESEMQDMAVRFGIALAREHYVSSREEFIDQVYWFIMFILSAFELFGPRLRHHIHRIAEYYFSLHSPDRLNALQRLSQQVEKGTITVLNSIGEDFCYYEQEPVKHGDQLSLTYLEKPRFLCQESPIHERRFSNFDSDTQDSWRWHWGRGSRLFWPGWEPSIEDKRFKSLLRIISDTMYERLQYKICQHLSGLLRQSSSGRLVRRSQFKAILDDLFRYECVQNEIDTHASRELGKIKPEIEKKHEESVSKLREYQDNQLILHAEWHPWSAFERQQDETLRYTLLLEKINQQTPILEDIRQEILKRLHTAARQQISEWLKTQREICQLRQIDFIEPFNDDGDEMEVLLYPNFFTFHMFPSLS